VSRSGQFQLSVVILSESTSEWALVATDSSYVSNNRLLEEDPEMLARVLGVTTLALGTVAASAFIAAPASATVVVTCVAVADNPHYSSGAGGVIFKTRVTCNGNSPVTFVGHLNDGPQIGPLLQVAAHSENRYVTGGVQNTFYVPNTGTPGVPCNKNLYYQGYATVTGSTTTSVTSNRVSGANIGCP
jgi:hypothetical protein